MSTIVDKLDRALLTARTMKDIQVANAEERGDTDIRAIIEGYRGDDTVVVLIPDTVDRDEALRAAAIAARAFGCDTIAMTNDSLHAITDHAMTNPYTGKPWERGEMQEAVETKNALAEGVITESLVTTVVNRAGDTAAAIQRYIIDKVNNRFHANWKETERSDDGIEYGGYVVEVLKDLMNQDTISHLMARDGVTGDQYDLTPEQTLAHQDCAIVKFMPALGWHGAVMLTSSNEERSAVIDKSLGERES